MALTAPSGRGKTTLCQLLAGYLVPASGCVLADGEPVRPIARLRGEASPVQLLPQHPELAFDPRVRLGRSLEEVAGAGEARARADELLGSFGVREEWLARRPHELSGGELMRLAMVRSLSVRPRYLIADESTAMLDAVTQAELWHVLMDLQERDGWGLVLVSHSPALVSRVATRRVELR
ncbi:MAG: ATP-binding cassette domain-containing protein [Coriobacteriaceae bacterium]|nr:ATP-binding cassette domain-containing protein [Coriobacteriaceae bacterium]